MNCPSCHAPLPLGAPACPSCGAAPAPAAPAAKKKSSKLVVLAVLAIVGGVFILFCGGIAAGIALPNLLNAIDRGKQKRSMADVRTIGTAIEEYKIDWGHYPVASDLDELRASLVPVFAADLPVVDGWGHAFLVASDGASYEIVSPGKNGLADGCGAGGTADFDADICFADGDFNQWPDGRQD